MGGFSFYSNIFHFILFIWFFYLFFMSRGLLWYDSSHHSCSSCFCSHHRCCCWICGLQKEERWEIQSNSAKLSYIISVLLSILNMVILNLCKRVALLLFFSVSERRPTSCKYDFIVCYLYFPLWSDSLDLKHYLCNRYIFSLALTALDNNAEQLQLNQVK